jgi:hypothetical protein
MAEKDVVEAIGRSLWKTWTVRLVCMSAAVVKISERLTGTGCAAGDQRCRTATQVSMPR